ncbi:hypothetical protein [Steroidobacter cummioxidans]|uniref:hypothetical protein n=1 Tax=Steroidobacter cummioxidans TaxID=1803913 RepID=UPI000E324252|nr:hypothetical protein [Steroidobacter cummioxidans]
MAPLPRAILSALPCLAVLGISGCWTAPVANVQPRGEPGLIQGGIRVESVKEPWIVESVDASARHIAFRAPGEAAPKRYRVAPSVPNVDSIRPGDKVQPTIAEDLTVYVLRDGQLQGAGESDTGAAHAKVLSVDASFRLLTVEHPNGKQETFKVAREVKLDQMEAGDDVAIQPREVVAVRLRKR